MHRKSAAAIKKKNQFVVVSDGKFFVEIRCPFLVIVAAHHIYWSNLLEFVEGTSLISTTSVQSFSSLYFPYFSCGIV